MKFRIKLKMSTYLIAILFVFLVQLSDTESYFHTLRLKTRNQQHYVRSTLTLSATEKEVGSLSKYSIHQLTLTTN